MTRATTRLRRAGVAGIAALALAGASLVTAGAASAAVNVAATTAVSTEVVYPGVNNQAAGDVTFTASTWNVGDKVVLTVGSGTNCNVTGDYVGFSSLPTVAATTTADPATTAPVFKATLSAVKSACGIQGANDTLTLELQNGDAASSPSSYTVKISGIKYNVGPNVATGNVAITAVPGAAVNNATVAHSKFTVGSVSSSAQNATVTLGTLTVSDVKAGTITSPITFTLTGGIFADPTAADSKPTMVGPAGSVWTFSRASSNTQLIATNNGTGAVAIDATKVNTFTLTGVKASFTQYNSVGPVAASYKLSVVASSAAQIGASSTVAVASDTVRTGGSDRYATAALQFGHATTAILASGTNFPDALSASVIAGQIPAARVLLTDPGTFPAITQSTILTENVNTIYILGDTKSVSKAIEDQLAATHVGGVAANALIKVTRLAGADRYATNAAVNLYKGAGTITADTAIVTTGEKFADALSVGPIVAKLGYGLVLTPAGALADGSKAALLNNPTIKNVVILGDTNSVSANVETQLKALGYTVKYRLAGTDRTLTAAAIATWATTSGQAFAKTADYAALAGLAWSPAGVAYIANGSNFPDALSAGPVAGAASKVILLTGDPNTLGAGIPSYFKGKAGVVTTVTPLGLDSSVSTAVVNAAIASLS